MLHRFYKTDVRMVLTRIIRFTNIPYMPTIIRNFCSVNNKNVNIPSQDTSKNKSVKKQEQPQFGKGDHGTSSLLSGGTLNKDDSVFDAIGATEELTSYLGLVKEFAQDAKHEYVDKIKRIQTILMDLNMCISKSTDKEKINFMGSHVTKELEEWIEEYSSKLPPSEQFIMPGGGKAGASLHVARSICRKTERTVVPLVRKGALNKDAQIYLNRLSDFLFTVARMAAKYDKRTESVYVPPPTSKDKVK